MCPRGFGLSIRGSVFPWHLKEVHLKEVLEHSGAENIGWLQRNMMRVGWGYMMKNLIPKVLGNVTGGRFTPGRSP